MRFALYLLASSAVFTGGAMLVGWATHSTIPKAENRLPPARALGQPQHSGAPQADAASMPAIQLELPPISSPELIAADKVDMPQDVMVIGVVVNGEPRAYACPAFGLDPGRHVVHDLIQSRRIAVTYCDRNFCSRVLSPTNSDDPLDVSVGGWRKDQTMELIVNDERYSHHSPDIPLADWPHVKMPWGQWRSKYPQTTVYVGNVAAAAIVPVE